MSNWTACVNSQECVCSGGAVHRKLSELSEETGPQVRSSCLRHQHLSGARSVLMLCIPADSN